VDRQAEGPGAPRQGLADAAHAHDAEALAGDAPPQHPGGRPAGPVPAGDDARPFGDPAGHRQDQRHGHVGGVLREHAGGVGDGDALGHRGRHVDVVDPVAEIGDELEAGSHVVHQGGVDLVGDGGNQTSAVFTASASSCAERALSSRLSRVSNNSRRRVSITSGRRRVTTTTGLFFIGTRCPQH
jgi:hypothetical protein